MNLYNRNIIRTPSEESPIIPPTPQPTISSPTFPHQYFGGWCDCSYTKIEATYRLITLLLFVFYKGKIVREETRCCLLIKFWLLGYLWVCLPFVFVFPRISLISLPRLFFLSPRSISLPLLPHLCPFQSLYVKDSPRTFSIVRSKIPSIIFAVLIR